MIRETEQESEKKIWLDMGAASEWMALSAEQTDAALSCGVSFLEWMFHQGYAVGLTFENNAFGQRRTATNCAQSTNLWPGSTRKLRRKPRGKKPFVDGESVDLLALWKGTN